MLPNNQKFASSTSNSISPLAEKEKGNNVAGKKRRLDSGCSKKMQNGRETCSSSMAGFKPHPVPNNFVIPKKGKGKDMAVLEKILKDRILLFLCLLIRITKPMRRQK